MKYYLAIDIGASGGRHILAHLENGKMVTEEIYRFPNGYKEVNGEKIWDIDELFCNVLLGMKKCAKLGKIPQSVGIDTWAVDFVLLDKDDNRLGNAVSYRDDRTRGMDSKVYEKMSSDALYAATGIQKQSFNSIYQLMALKERNPKQLEEACSLLMIPDYINYMLSGVKAQEYTNATTTQLVNPTTQDWNWELIKKLGYPERIFLPIRQPGTVIGSLKKDIQTVIGYNCNVVLPATHDTGSAVVAVPSNDENVLYISSGTWSLMGTELDDPDCSYKSMLKNFTNEGGYGNKYRFLKNIMGLWMIQSVKKEIGIGLSYGEICDAASKCSITSIVDANDDRFLAPQNMTEEIKNACREAGQQVPEKLDEVAAVIYNSLAKCYAKTLLEIESLTGRTYHTINVVGGGANADYLNRLTAKYTGRKVVAGPTEATAIGNIAVQMIADDAICDLKNARQCVYVSFDIRVYDPYMNESDNAG